MIRVLPVMAMAAFVLSACGGGAPKGAAESASRLLAAAVAGDRAAFEAEIDRAAVRNDIRRQVAAVARGQALEIEGGPSEFALDRMISPTAIRLVHARTGQPLAKAPTVDQVAELMRELDADHACLKGRKGDCLLTFAREDRAWRLVGMKAVDIEIAVASAR